jgi:hypothetical protein
MADQDGAKTKSIGHLPMEKVQTLKGWDEYVDKSSRLSILRTETQKAKNCVKDALRERLNENDEIDFVADGDRIRIFRIFRKQQQGRRARSLDLSSSFREYPLEGPSETKSPSDDNKQFAPDLDPVTERLMAIMREKRER